MCKCSAFIPGAQMIHVSDQPCCPPISVKIDAKLLDRGGARADTPKETCTQPNNKSDPRPGVRNSNRAFLPTKWKPLDGINSMDKKGPPSLRLSHESHTVGRVLGMVRSGLVTHLTAAEASVLVARGAPRSMRPRILQLHRIMAHCRIRLRQCCIFIQI